MKLFNKKITINSIFIGFFWFWVGVTFSNLFYYLRFTNKVLRNELIDIMKTSNNYFLVYFYVDLVFTLILMGTYIYFYRRNLFSKKEGKSK